MCIPFLPSSSFLDFFFFRETNVRTERAKAAEKKAFNKPKVRRVEQ